MCDKPNSKEVDKYSKRDKKDLQIDKVEVSVFKRVGAFYWILVFLYIICSEM